MTSLALFGRNGSGKTTLLRVAGRAASIPAAARSTGKDARRVRAPEPEHAAVRADGPAELESTLRLLGRAHDDAVVDHWLDTLHLAELARATRAASPAASADASRSPPSPSVARRCCCSTSRHAAWTRASRHALERAVREHARAGGAVVLATHDVELAARCATRAVVLGDGDVVADGDARHVLAGSLFAPQVLRVLPPYLTVEEVEAELARTSAAR